MAKVSVIITAFNVEDYIVSAVNSVVSQTLKDVEIVVVDDCSTDKTSALIESLAALDRRIRLIRHDENKSVMIARKTGVDAATGEYILFLDGDDMLAPNACEEAYQTAKNEQVDVLQFETQLFSDKPEGVDPTIEENVRAYLQSIEHKKISVSPCGLLDTEAVGGNINFTLWNKLYRAEVLKAANAHVPNEYMNIAEDVLLSYLIQYFARSFAYSKEKLHRYRLGSGITTAASARVSDRKLQAVAKGVYSYTYLKQWTEARGTERTCRAALLRIRKQMFTNVSTLYFRQLERSQRAAFFAAMEPYATKEDLLLMLHESLTIGEGMSTGDLASACENLPIFRSDKTEVKTIGAYYFRVRNGGIENVLSTLTDVWVKNGYNVVLFTDEKPNKSDYAINPAVKRVTLPVADGLDTDSVEARIKAFREAILTHGIDLMVYNAWVSPNLLLDEMIVKSCGTKLIMHTHGMFCFDIANASSHWAYQNSVLGQVYRLADAVVSLTDVDVAWWRAQGLRSFKTVNPIKLPLDVEPSALTGHRVLMVGRISPEKRVIDAIKIVERVKERVPDVTLTIVGKADLREYAEEVEDYIRQKKLKPYVTLAGFDTNVLPYYQKADLLLSTSEAEGFGLVLMEGKLCGLPLVTYELPNLDITRENRGMVTVPQSDIEAAAEAVMSILQDDARKKTLGQEARAGVQAMYSVDFAEIWKQIIEETMKPKTKPLPISKMEPSEIAIRIAVDAYTKGIWERSQGYVGTDVAMGGGDWRYYEEQCKVLSKALKELANSESYRFGLFMTAIPRKIKNWFQRRRKKQ